MSEGVDYSFARPSPAGLKAAGKSFAVRYLTGQGKALSRDELTKLRAHGLQVGLVFESVSGRALAGSAAGKQDATVAVAASKALGLKLGPIFFAVDFDASDAQKPRIADYLNGAASVLGKKNTGVYGSYYVVKYMAEHDVCDWFWQTYAWSGGLFWKLKVGARMTAGRKKHPLAQLYQYRNGVKLAGGEVDLCRSYASDFGQYPRPKAAPKPSPLPKPKPAPKPAPKPTPVPKPSDKPFVVRVVAKDGSTEEFPSRMPGFLKTLAQFRRGKFKSIEIERA